jgi:hypothetical protein
MTPNEGDQIGHIPSIPQTTRERSRGGEGMVGRDSTSSAQSKRAGCGEMARLGSSWGEPGRMGGKQGVGRGRGMFAGEDGVVGDAGGVYHTNDAETARLRGVWGVERVAGVF